MLKPVLALALVSAATLLSGCGGEPAAANTTTPPPAAAIHGERIQANTARAATATPTATTTNAAPTEVAKATPTAPPPAAAKVEMAAEAEGDYPLVGFDKLASYTYEMPDESTGPATNNIPEKWTKKDQIPDNIRAFNGKKVAIKGFMLPLKVEKGLITELLIMRDQSACCYGNVPKINEWVSVKMKGEGVKPAMDQAITLYGTLKVGEMRENGYLVGIYEMAGERMSVPLDL